MGGRDSLANTVAGIGPKGVEHSTTLPWSYSPNPPLLPMEVVEMF